MQSGCGNKENCSLGNHVVMFLSQAQNEYYMQFVS